MILWVILLFCFVLFCFLGFSPGLDLKFDGGLTSQLGKPRPVLCPLAQYLSFSTFFNMKSEMFFTVVAVLGS